MHDWFANGHQDVIKTFKYDSMGRKTEENKMFLDFFGALNNMITFKYDIKGNKINEIKDSHGDGKPEEEYTFEYDSVGNIIKKICVDYNYGRSVSTTTFKYDNKRRKTEETHWCLDSNGRPAVIHTDKYDSTGELL